ncbi:MAG: hypothetical protein ACU843_15700 [Gammaproteobacteria bacterium]
MAWNRLDDGLLADKAHLPKIFHRNSPGRPAFRFRSWNGLRTEARQSRATILPISILQEGASDDERIAGLW